MSRLIKIFVIGSLALLSGLPYIFWLLSQMGIAISWLNAFIIIVVWIFVLKFGLRLYMGRSQYISNKNAVSILSGINTTFKTKVYRLSFIFLMLILVAIVYYGYSSYRDDSIQDVPVVEFEEQI